MNFLFLRWLADLAFLFSLVVHRCCCCCCCCCQVLTELTLPALLPDILGMNRRSVELHLGPICFNQDRRLSPGFHGDWNWPDMLRKTFVSSAVVLPSSDFALHLAFSSDFLPLSFVSMSVVCCVLGRSFVFYFVCCCYVISFWLVQMLLWANENAGS